MTLLVKPYAPKCRLRIYRAGGEVLDLTDAHVLSINTSRSIDAATGRWAAQLVGRYQGERMAAHIAPMDYVEIELARVPTGGGVLQMAMRGFVDNVQQSLRSGTWRASINGRDFGKLLLQFQIYYMTEIDPVAAMIPQARLEMNFGIPGGVLSAPQFVQLITDKIIGPNLKALQAENPAIPDLVPQVEVPARFAVDGFAVQPFTGSVYNLLTQYASKPWIEVFIDDNLFWPVLRYRFAPLRGVLGGPISDFSTQPKEHSIWLSDVESLAIGVSDNEIGTYFFTYPEHSLLNRIAFKGAGLDLARNPYVAPNFLMQRYGFRPMEVGTRLIPSSAGESADYTASAQPDELSSAAELNQWLVRAYRDGYLFENGTLEVKGGGEFHPGEYVTIVDMEKCFYISSVDHSFDITGGQFRTTLGVVRGYRKVRS